ncbi:MAG: pyridine nucleotide-disulfide oxidoreductase, partial [Acidimicrobiia bacterium]
PPDITSLTPDTCCDVDRLDGRAVLVVGASASGVQLADEIARTGREVVVAVGEHVRLPRRYRDRDVFWWLDAAGVLDQTYLEVDDLVRARRLPSPQLVGSPDGRSVDLAALAGRGVQLVGRLVAIDDRTFRFSGGLRNVCALADLKMNRLLESLDEWAAATEFDGPAPERFAATPVPQRPALEIPIGRIGTVVWATGYHADHSWIGLPVLDRRGDVRHDGGVVSDAPGMYLLGAPLLRRRRSSYISGADADARDLAGELHHHLDTHCSHLC